MNGSMSTEDQKDVLRQLRASIVIHVESTKESNKISKLEYKRKVDEDKEKKITWEVISTSEREITYSGL